MNLSRQTGPDLVRALATLFVLSVHFFLRTKFYSTSLVGNNMHVQVFLRMSFFICVPLFMILTGYLQVNKTPTKKYFKKIIPILAIYLIYSLIAIFVREFHLNEHQTPLKWFGLILSFQADNYAWYINMYIGLFLLAPYINIIYKNIETKKQKLILIAILIFISAVPSFFNYKARGILFFPDFWVDIYPLTYYLIGCYLQEYQVKINKIVGVIAILFITLLEAFIEIHYAAGIFNSMAGYYSSLPIMIHSVIFFLIFYDINIKSNFLVKMISFISILSLDIFLASNITDKIIYNYIFNNLYISQQQILIWMIPIVLSSFIFAIMLSYFRHKLIKLR